MVAPTSLGLDERHPSRELPQVAASSSLSSRVFQQQRLLRVHPRRLPRERSAIAPRRAESSSWKAGCPSAEIRNAAVANVCFGSEADTAPMSALVESGHLPTELYVAPGATRYRIAPSKILRMRGNFRSGCAPLMASDDLPPSGSLEPNVVNPKRPAARATVLSHRPGAINFGHGEIPCHLNVRDVR